MYKTHRTEGSVVPVAVRHVSPKIPVAARGGGRETRAGTPGERNTGGRRPGERQQSTGRRRPSKRSRVRAGDARQAIHGQATARRAIAERGRATAQPAITEYS